jgi:hypothetical protein
VSYDTNKNTEQNWCMEGSRANESSKSSTETLLFEKHGLSLATLVGLLSFYTERKIRSISPPSVFWTFR